MHIFVRFFFLFNCADGRIKRKRIKAQEFYGLDMFKTGSSGDFLVKYLSLGEHL